MDFLDYILPLDNLISRNMMEEENSMDFFDYILPVMNKPSIKECMTDHVKEEFGDLFPVFAIALMFKDMTYKKDMSPLTENCENGTSFLIKRDQYKSYMSWAKRSSPSGEYKGMSQPVCAARMFKKAFAANARDTINMLYRKDFFFYYAEVIGKDAKDCPHMHFEKIVKTYLDTISLLIELQNIPLMFKKGEAGISDMLKLKYLFSNELWRGRKMKGSIPKAEMEPFYKAFAQFFKCVWEDYPEYPYGTSDNISPYKTVVEALSIGNEYAEKRIHQIGLERLEIKGDMKAFIDNITFINGSRVFGRMKNCMTEELLLFIMTHYRNARRVDFTQITEFQFSKMEKQYDGNKELLSVKYLKDYDTSLWPFARKGTLKATSKNDKDITLKLKD